MTQAPLRFVAVAATMFLGSALLTGPGCVITESVGDDDDGGSTATTTTGGGSAGNGGDGAGGMGAGGLGAGGTGAGGMGGSSSPVGPFTCGASECAVGSEQCCWDDDDTGSCVTDPNACAWFVYECTSPSHCADDGLCCVLPGLSSFCLPAISEDCGGEAMACDTIADCPDLNGAPATDCLPSTAGGPAHNVCVW